VNYALTVYPLSNGFRGRLERELAARPVYLSLSDLRSKPPREALRRLRQLKCAKRVLPLEDENLLKLTVAARSRPCRTPTSPRSVSGSAQRAGQPMGSREVGACSSASVVARLNAASCNRELTALLQAP
jgi:hypothetical protein